MQHKLPQALEAYRAGSPIAFGNLIVRQQGLADSTRELAWADIDHIQISDSSIQITKKPAGMVWFNWDAMLRLMWTRMLLCGDDRGKTAKHLLECKQFVIELAVRGHKVDQHW